MIVLLVEPGCIPRRAEIEDSLEAMQAVVGRYIQAVYPFNEPVALVCNEEGKLFGHPLNRTLRDEETGEIYDIIVGTFFLCAAPPNEEHFADLTEEQLERYAQLFRAPEFFLEVVSDG